MHVDMKAELENKALEYIPVKKVVINYSLNADEASKECNDEE